MSDSKLERDKAVRSSVKMIALARKVCEMAGEDVEEFDRELNKMCDEWHSKFADMNAADLARFMLTDLINDVLERE